jgi:TIR domain-containing protein
MSNNHPSVFVSYSWDSESHKVWVKELCSRLREDGIDVTLDQWEVAPGDQLPAFMEQSIQGSDFVLIVCTPRYKEKADKRIGGVGFEENIITGEAAGKLKDRKFIPVLAKGEWESAAPTWVLGKAFIDLRGDGMPQPKYEDLLITLHEQRESPPPIGKGPVRRHAAPKKPKEGDPQKHSRFKIRSVELEEIRITEILADDVSQPRNDGTRGSALYAVPFQLSRTPSSIWKKAFLQTWEHPPTWTSMHRPGIARIQGDRIILDGTTLEEVERYHQTTLLQAVSAANSVEAQIQAASLKQEALQGKKSEEHRKSVKEAAKRIKFD